MDKIFKRRERPENACKTCGELFVMKTYNQVFCCKKCRDNFFNDMKATAMHEYRKRHNHLKD